MSRHNGRPQPVRTVGPPKGDPLDGLITSKNIQDLPSMQAALAMTPAGVDVGASAPVAPLLQSEKPATGSDQLVVAHIIAGASRAVALGKLNAFVRQASLLAVKVQQGMIPKRQAVDAIWEIALANDLIEIHGPDHIQVRIAQAFAAEQSLGSDVWWAFDPAIILAA